MAWSYRQHFSRSASLSLARVPLRPRSPVLAEAAVTRDGDQAIRGSWLGRIFSRSPRRGGAVYIFHRLEILFARSAAKLSRFEIFMNGSGERAPPDQPPANKEGRQTVPRSCPPTLRTICDCRVGLDAAPLAFSFMRFPAVLLRPRPRYCLWNSSNGARIASISAV